MEVPSAVEGNETYIRKKVTDSQLTFGKQVDIILLNGDSGGRLLC